MTQNQLHQQLQQASQQIKSAESSVQMAQGSDPIELENAEQQLQQAEETLKFASAKGGREATENSQFQQAYEQLHDLRQQVQKAQQKNDDTL